jgi:ribosomal protein L32E
VINDELLAARKKVAHRRPKFIRQESWRYDRLAQNWGDLRARTTR